MDAEERWSFTSRPHENSIRFGNHTGFGIAVVRWCYVAEGIRGKKFRDVDTIFM